MRDLYLTITSMYVALLSAISGMASSSHREKATPRGRGQGRRTPPWILLQWTLIHLRRRYPIRQFSRESRCLTLTFQVLPGHCHPHMALTTTRPHTSPTKAACASLHTTFLILSPSRFSPLCSRLPHPLTLSHTKHKRTFLVVKVMHSLVMGALELGLGLSRMVAGNTSILISYTLFQ